MEKKKLTEYSPTGAMVGAYSAHRAMIRRTKHIEHLKEKLKSCTTPECKKQVHDAIAALKTKVHEKDASIVKRSIVGAATTPLGAIGYHYYDKLKEKNQIKKLNKLS